MSLVEFSSGSGRTVELGFEHSLKKSRRAILLLSFCLAMLGGLIGCNGSAQPPRANRAIPVRPVRVKLLEDIELLDVRVSGGYVITDDKDNVLRRASSGGLLKLRRADDGILVNSRLVARKSLYIKPTSFAPIQVADRKYRGYLRMLINRNGSLLAINYVPLEHYVASVLGGELPAYFHPQTFRAQAVAARSYVLHRMLNTDRRDWDVAATAASQVYGGLSNETDMTTRAQRSTRGQVLVYNSGGREQVLCTFYSSTCGGGTQAVWEVKEGFPHIEPLGGVEIDLCQKSRFYNWEKIVWSKKDLRKALLARYGSRNAELAKLGPIESVKVSRWSDKRAKQITIVDERGRKVRISGPQLRTALKLPSTWFRIEDHREEVWFTHGHGWGHGMGMCQFGAERMAQMGQDYRKILATYYPGSELVRFYD